MSHGGEGSRLAACEMIAALVKADRTIPELAEMTGCHWETCANWIRAFQMSGLIYRNGKRPARGWGGKRAQIYAWQPSPFAKVDVCEESTTTAQETAAKVTTAHVLKMTQDATLPSLPGSGAGTAAA